MFALDTLINKLLKKLLKVVADETDTKVSQLFANEKSWEPGEVAASVYLEQVRVILRDHDIYLIQSSSSPGQLMIRLMDNSHENPEVATMGP